jgi:hypothetical protein
MKVALPTRKRLSSIVSWLAERMNEMTELSEGMSFAITFLLGGGIAFLIYQMDCRVKSQGTLFPQSASIKTKLYALLLGLLMVGLAFLSWFASLPLYWLLFIISFVLIGYSFGLGQPLTALQAKQLRSLPLLDNRILKIGLGFFGIFVMIILFAAMGGLVGALLGMLVAIIASANGFVAAAIGAIIGAVVMTVDFMTRLEQSKIIKVSAGIIAGIMVGTVVALSYGSVWVINGSIIGLIGGIVGLANYRRGRASQSAS